jgi:flagellar hook-length control protein FliK
VEAPGISGQIFLGLSQNLKAGKGEFVLKLIPEGLGEITVKLLETEGRTTLRIITASAETAKLINQDLAALQNALKPIRVEVREAVAEAPESREEASYYAGFDQFSQFSQFNQFGNQSGSREASGTGHAARISGEPEVGSPLPRAAAPNSDLDRYV